MKKGRGVCVCVWGEILEVPCAGISRVGNRRVGPPGTLGRTAWYEPMEKYSGNTRVSESAMLSTVQMCATAKAGVVAVCRRGRPDAAAHRSN